MRASKIQCHYADLNNAAQQLLRTVQNYVQQLQGGAWRGKGANTFYAELDCEVLPCVQRLISALRDASSATQRIGQLLEQAEREAGALFMGGAGDAEGYGGGGSHLEWMNETQGRGQNDQERIAEITDDLKNYGITLTGNWTLAELEKLQSAIHAAAERLSRFAASQYPSAGYNAIFQEILQDKQQAFRLIFGNLTFARNASNSSTQGWWGRYNDGTITLWNGAFTGALNSLANISPDTAVKQAASTQFLIFHELGHVLNDQVLAVGKNADGRYVLIPEESQPTVEDRYRLTSQSNSALRNGTVGYPVNARTDETWIEYQADAVANWLGGNFNDSTSGKERRTQIDEIMREVIYTRLGLPFSAQVPQG